MSQLKEFNFTYFLKLHLNGCCDHENLVDWFNPRSPKGIVVTLNPNGGSKRPYQKKNTFLC